MTVLVKAHLCRLTQSPHLFSWGISLELDAQLSSVAVHAILSHVGQVGQSYVSVLPVPCRTSGIGWTHRIDLRWWDR